MTGLDWWLPVIWAGVIAAAVAMYVVLDGFDLGIGILFPTTKDEAERDVMMNSVAPFWDGNETWLVLGGGGLLVAFPLAYAVIMPALYLPVILMLLALVLRGVAFEFRWVAKPRQGKWDIAFAGGSIIASFMQGVILGGLLQGIRVENRAFAGGAFDWLTPFSILCGLGLVAGYALLAACWLIMKTEGRVADHARGMIRPLLVLVALAGAAVSIWTPLQIARIAERWFSLPNFLYLAPLPILTALLALVIWRHADRDHGPTPFFAAIGVFLLCFAGLAVSNFPYLVPPSLTIWDTAAVPSAQIFMLVGVAILFPVILGYTAFVYWTFRGKVKEGEGYH